MKKQTKLNIIFISALLLNVNFVLAAIICPEFRPTPPFDAGLGCLILWGLYLGLSLSGILLFALLIVNGVKYFTAIGNVKQIREIRSNIKAAFLGIIVLFLSVIFLAFLNPELLLLGKGADISFSLSLDREEKIVERNIFVNPDKPINIYFYIYWEIKGAKRCEAFKIIPEGANVTGWEGEKASTDGQHSTLVTIAPPHIRGAHSFLLRCYGEGGLFTIRIVMATFKPVQARLSDYQFKGDHNCYNKPENCCPKSTDEAGYKWTICDKYELKQPHRAILGLTRGWIQGGKHCNNWTTTDSDYKGDIFNPIEGITMFHRQPCDISYQVWCCIKPISS